MAFRKDTSLSTNLLFSYTRNWQPIRILHSKFGRTIQNSKPLLPSNKRIIRKLIKLYNETWNEVVKPVLTVLVNTYGNLGTWSASDAPEYSYEVPWGQQHPMTQVVLEPLPPHPEVPPFLQHLDFATSKQNSHYASLQTHLCQHTQPCLNHRNLLQWTVLVWN